MRPDCSTRTRRQTYNQSRKEPQIALIKRIVLLKRKPGMSRQEFRDHWVNQHAQTVKTFPQVKKYVVNFFSPSLSDPPFDGVAELWFEDETKLKEYETSQEVASFVKEDNPKFMDTAKRFSAVVDEVIIK